ncbi:MAG TPA: PEP-utilizing enzyme, partial [Acidimicrobiia bacterium]
DAAAIFDLTLDEVLQPEPLTAVDALVTQRRQRRAHYETLRVPPVFIGRPTVSPAATPAGNGAGDLRGVAVSPGIVEGPARVITDPSQETRPIDPGEILVCHVTDPSWMTLMIGAAALVTDVGSVISHAAIAARELGIPCVVGTERATAVVRSGDRLRVDGGTGTVVLPHESEVTSHGPTSP